ncbi:RIP metalloprotease RseP [Paracoccus sp. S-4012]|uniref:RIP metalloprotease RseP n=1 Tax=Paracoccus sp. S-4012 TaxID=2665648 RepID=UPI0012B08D43|nr:RIP metalloprotease RseP [Paracoccus sp. S-4012]MRX49607.1 RIP metalloprotease RseP [Paracoccus sp. S-4012]
MMELLPAFGGGLRSIAAFIVALGVIVAVHEFGHYIIGRWSGIRAEVFSIGFGPRLAARRDRRGTLWQVAAVPLGGYVRFLGDADVASAGKARMVDPALRRQTLDGAPLWARVATVAAGPAFSFLLALVIFAGFALVRGLPAETPTIGGLSAMPPGVESALEPGDRILGVGGQPVEEWADLPRLSESLAPALVQTWAVERGGTAIEVPGPDPFPALIGGVAPRGAAADAGLRPGDVILGIDGKPVLRFDELRTRVEAAEGAPLTLTIWREGRGNFEAELTPREQDVPREGGGFERRWLIGVTGGSGYIEPALRRAGPIEALRLGAVTTWGVVASSVQGIAAMVTGQISTCNIGGAITIAESTGQAAAVGFADFVWWIGILSAAIGFLNLLPIPVLDGGHLAFYLWEAVTGRPPAERVAGWLTTAGLMIVLGLMIFGLSNDLFCP